jgi:hypothetical protein
VTAAVVVVGSVDVDVIAFVIVAVHLNVNDTVGVILPVDLRRSGSIEGGIRCM